MEFRILGSLEVASDARKPDLGPPKQKALLAILLLHPNEIVATERLVDLLWAEQPPRTANHSVQIYVSELRKAISPLAGEPVIVTRPPGYLLEVDPGSIDAHRFERLVDEAGGDLRAGGSSAGAEKLRRALDLWRGPALSEFTYEEFAQQEIRRLTDLRIAAHERLAAAELETGRPLQALAAAEAAIREDPLHERLRELLMLALYRTGRHAEALRAYDAFRTKLADELGLDPSPSLRRLQERILLHDPTLIPAELEPSAEPVTHRNPYKGLRPFGEDDAEDFFGRSSLAESVARSLLDGDRLVALVGPSGSGKSSVVAAGVVPRFRAEADGWTVAAMVPGPRAGDELDGVLAAAASGERLLLVIDQFEEAFSVTPEPERGRFLRSLGRELGDPAGRLSVLLTLRADFYGSPLLDPEFGPVFTSGVLNVLPMTADELADAVTGPVERVGVPIEPALTAQLIADTAGQPGALPLLQFALTELFERREGSELTLDGYRELGGLRGVVSRRAEELYAQLDAEAQHVAMQVFLRLVRLGREGAGAARRRAPVAELTDLDLDPVALSEVLDRFGRHRLLSFDRDADSGDAIVEVAHESLFWEWDRLAGWIERYRAALRKHEVFLAAVAEWEAADRDPDYLLTGSRLSEFESWSADASIRLTAVERAFLDAGLERRRSEQVEEASRRDQQQRLERRARTRLVALFAAVVLLAGAFAYGGLSWLRNRPAEVVLVDSRGSGLFGDAVTAGLNRAVRDFGIRGERAIVPGFQATTEDLRAVSERSPEVVIALQDLCAVIDQAAREHPDIRYVVFDCLTSEPGVVSVSFATEQGAYLAGAAAALKSETGVIGFVGGADIPPIWQFQAGFEAGARAIDPTIQVGSVYLGSLSARALNPFDAEPVAFQVATGMYEEGADVVFSVAGASGLGVLEAALQYSEAQGRHVWAIGVDVDQYAPGEDLYYPHVLTSMVKRFDVAVYALLEEHARGSLRPGPRFFDLAAGGVEITYSGGFLDEFRPRIEALAADIAAGRVDVPCVPEDRLDEAVEAGLDPEDPCVAIGG